jgi:hypothetical protein
MLRDGGGAGGVPPGARRSQSEGERRRDGRSSSSDGSGGRGAKELSAVHGVGRFGGRLPRRTSRVHAGRSERGVMKDYELSGTGPVPRSAIPFSTEHGMIHSVNEKCHKWTVKKSFQISIDS